MNQILKRMLYFINIINTKQEEVYEKYNMNTIEYTIMYQISHDDVDNINDLIEKVDYQERVIYSSLSSLEEKKYIDINDNAVSVRDEYKKILPGLRKDLKSLDRGFDEQANSSNLKDCINVLDELIDSFEN